MAITPFKIINDDGSTNQSEYERCVQFLNDYVEGKIPVYPPLSWDNPFEVDMSRDKSALSLLVEILKQETNRLLTPNAFNNIKLLFKGILDRYGATIHTCGRYLEQSANFKDGPGYMYDVFSKEETPVKKETISSNLSIYYLDDEAHTVIEYNDTAYANTIDSATLPDSNYPLNNLVSKVLVSNVDTYPNVYKGNLAGVYSEFQRLSGQYVGSSTLFYYSECNDTIFTTNGNGFQDKSTGEVINFNYNMPIGNKAQPVRGIPLDKCTALQSNVLNQANTNAYLTPDNVNGTIPYISPKTLLSVSSDDVENYWILI